MLANYLIGLREGLEAALVVSILIAYLVRTDRRSALPWVWTGVGAAVLMSILAGALLEYTAAALSDTAEELFGGIMSIVAVVLVTWMILWMRTASRTIADDLRGRMATALEVGVGAVILMSFVAVAREGLETAVFLFSAVRTAGTTTTPLLGFTLGLATSVAMGWLLYRRAVVIDLGRFFHWTGLLLIFVAAGVLSHGVHELQEAGVLPGEDNLAFDVSAAIPPSSWYGTLLKGVFNFSPQTTVLQAVTWTAYVVVTLFLYLRPVRSAALERPAGVTSSTAN